MLASALLHWLPQSSDAPHAFPGSACKIEPLTGAIDDMRAFAADLLAGKFGPVVEAIAGPATNDADVSVRWNLSRHARKSLRLYLVDAETDAWGFVSVSEMSLSEPRDVR
jgi:hypothetical protein